MRTPDHSGRDSQDDGQLPALPLDEALLAAARRYRDVSHPAPVEEMWTAIKARRVNAGARDGRTRGVMPIRAGSGRTWRPRSLRQVAAAAVAAVALVSVGIAIGRTTAGAPVVVGTQSSKPADRSDPPSRVAERGAGATTVDMEGDGASVASVPPPGTPPAMAPVLRGERASPGPDARDRRELATLPLRVATEQYLTRAEALLTGVVLDRGGAVAADAAWARDLLTTTRLLLDFPAGRDPARRALLEELELVLGQLARLPRADTPMERALIDAAIRDGDLLPRLRAAIPAGAPRRDRGA